jgi:hypothetical protein
MVTDSFNNPAARFDTRPRTECHAETGGLSVSPTFVMVPGLGHLGEGDGYPTPTAIGRVISAVIGDRMSFCPNWFHTLIEAAARSRCSRSVGNPRLLFHPQIGLIELGQQGLTMVGVEPSRRFDRSGRVRHCDQPGMPGTVGDLDAQRRDAAIGSTYAPDVRRTDGEGVRVSREALEAMDRVRRSGSHSSALRSQPPSSAAAS